MIVYHLLYDLKYIFNKDLGFFSIESWYPIQQLICWTFIFLSGFSTTLSRSSLKNGIKVFLGGMALTVVTSIVMPDFSIKFGVLHLIGLSMILTSFFNKGEIKYPFIKGALSFILFFLFWKIGLENLKVFYSLRNNELLFPLGIYSEGFSSSDYFPLIPWFFLFLTGFFIGHQYKSMDNFLLNLNFNGSFISYIGKNSFPIYMAHQVVIMGVLTLLSWISII